MLDYIEQVQQLLVGRGKNRGLSDSELLIIEECFKTGFPENQCASYILELRAS